MGLWPQWLVRQGVLHARMAEAYALRWRGVVEESVHVPRIILLQQEWARKKVIGPPPTWEESLTRPFGGVFAGPWPRWKRVLCRLTGLSLFSPPRLL